MTKLFTTQIFIISLFLVATFPVKGQTTEFPYSDILNGTSLPDGNYNLKFRLYNALTGSSQIGSVISKSGTPVVGLGFSVTLDFGAAVFPGDDRYLEISYRDPVTGVDTPISPRRKILSLPYAIRSLKSTTADNATQLNGTAASEYVQTNDTRLSDSRDPNAGSGNYIQNATSPQTSANFNIAGTGTAAVLNANQYDNGGLRVLKAYGPSNALVVGIGAGGTSSTGVYNTFIGGHAGFNNTIGYGNAFVGASAGLANTTGNGNSYFGTNAGKDNTIGSHNAFFGISAGALNAASGNSFFGARAGEKNHYGTENAYFGFEAGRDGVWGTGNSFFGYQAGQFNTSINNTFVGKRAGAYNTGPNNVYIGFGAGFNNTSGQDNTFVGAGVANDNTTGNSNVFVGHLSARTNTTGSRNTLLGTETDVGASGLSYATAIGSGAIVNSSNSVLIGRNSGADTVEVPGKLKVFQLGTAGSTQLAGMPATRSQAVPQASVTKPILDHSVLA